MKDIDFTAVGYPSIDRIVKVASTPCVGKTSIIKNEDNNRAYYGGCNVNVSYIGSSLGLNCALVMKVGRDFESSGFKKFLQDKKVNLEGVDVIEEDVTSCSYLIMNEDGEHITLFYPGAMDTKYKCSIKEDVIKRSRYGIITVGNPDYNLQFARLCKKHGIPIVFGMKCDFKAFTQDILEEIISGCEILVMNESEREELEKLFGVNDVSQFFKNGSTRIIIVTKGKRGSHIIQYDGCKIQTHDIPVAKERRIVDTTGVGDAYLAGFMAAYIKGKPVVKCGRMGSVIASFVIEEMGCLSNVPTFEEIYNRYRISYKEEF